MSRFQGSNSISSDDYFGRASNTPKSSVASTLSSANFYDIKEGVRDGVTKVAGKLSTLATDVMSSIQVNWILNHIIFSIIYFIFWKNMDPNNLWL